jgi:EAL and modified HD-GYP domain-containing signal transduction protein
VHHDHHFARQPIVDRTGRILGYELLYRAEPRADIAVFVDGVAATRSVLESLARGDRALFGGRPSFVNLPRPLILDRTVVGMDPRRVAVEVLEDVVSDAEILAALDELRSRGFTVALDDFRPEPARMSLVAHADIVKLDVLDLDPSKLARLVRELHHCGALVLAEKVETADDLERCLSDGFDLFQGYAVGLPTNVTVFAPRRPLVVRPRRRALGVREVPEPLRP